jgi:hypothetical protein
MNVAEDTGNPQTAGMEGLEEALRQVPVPEPPADLERRLLAAIPSLTHVKRRTRALSTPRLAIAVAASLVAALAICGGLLIRSHDIRVPGGTAGPLNDTSPRYILDHSYNTRLKETNPCDIVLPLPYSRS